MIARTSTPRKASPCSGWTKVTQTGGPASKVSRNVYNAGVRFGDLDARGMTMNSTLDREGAIKKLGELIHGMKIAMLTTVTANGALRSRPMATLDAAFDGRLWFFTHASGSKADEALSHPRVNLSYADEKAQRYVSVSGAAAVIRDRAKAAQLWKPELATWFKGGLDDPALTLLEITVEEAEYWDAPTRAMVVMAGFIQAVLRSSKPGEHEKIDLRP